MKWALRMKRKGPEHNYYGSKKAKPSKDGKSNMEKNHTRPLSNLQFKRQIETEKRSKLLGIKNPPVKTTTLKNSKASNLSAKSNSLVVDVEPVKDDSKCTCSSTLLPWMSRMEQKQDLIIQKLDALTSTRNKEVNEANDNNSVSPGEATKTCIGEIRMMNTEDNGAMYEHFEIHEISFMDDNGSASQNSVGKNSAVETIANTQENVANDDQIKKDGVVLVKKNDSAFVQAFDSGYVCQDAVEKNSEAMSKTQENVANDDQSRKDGAGFMEKNGSDSIPAFDSIGIIDEMINSIAFKFPYRETNDPKVFNDEMKESTALFTKMATYLSGIGGTGPRATLNMFNKILSKELQGEFNWDDKGTTIQSFPYLISVIHAAGRLSQGSTYNEKYTNEMIKNSLRNARAKKKNGS